MLMESCGSFEALGTLLEALGRLKKAQRRSLEVLKKSIRASEWSPKDLERLLGN